MKRVHFVGIKGVAMSALALWYKEAGYSVTGSDISDEFPTDEILSQNGITVLDFSPKNITNIRPDLVIYTGAHGGRQNDEVVAAEAVGIPALPHGKALGSVMKSAFQISVAGSHGKTTTSAMVATVLALSGQDPSWAIGCGMIRGLGFPGHFGKGKIFVAEADEYITDPGHDATPRFLWQNPDILVVTNIDYDHPDAYSTLSDVQEAFVNLQGKQKENGTTIINADDRASEVLRTNAVTYGTTQSADYQVTGIRFGPQRTYFTLHERGMEVGEFTLKIPGKHNALNAAAAVIACRLAGVSWQDCKKYLAQFGGTKRRFEMIGEVDGVRIIDDYAHHPDEIRATLAAAHTWYPDKRIFAVFQPHTYSRTRALLSEFAKSFANAYEVILTDIYASAREHETLGINGKTLVSETAKYHRNVYYEPDYGAVSKLLHEHMGPGDIVLFMGAGNIYTWGRKLISQ